jgi:hypothetical protein
VGQEARNEDGDGAQGSLSAFPNWETCLGLHLLLYLLNVNCKEMNDTLEQRLQISGQDMVYLWRGDTLCL